MALASAVDEQASLRMKFEEDDAAMRKHDAAMESARRQGRGAEDDDEERDPNDIMTSLLSSLPTCPVRISRRLVVLCSLHQRSFYKGPRDTVQTHLHPDEHSFERLGLQARVLAGLRLAFPSVKHPTPIQHRFVEELLKGKDVLLKDSTGSGKCVLPLYPVTVLWFDVLLVTDPSRWHWLY